MTDTAITFTYKVLDVDFPRDGLERCTIEMTLAGDVYLIDAELDDDEGWGITVTLEDVDQINEDVTFEKVPGSMWDRRIDNTSYFSRTIPLDWLEDWINEEIFWPINKAIGEATVAALKAMDGATGTVDWKADE